MLDYDFWCALMETTLLSRSRSPRASFDTTLLFRFYCMWRTRQLDTFECHYDVKINFMINVRHVERNDRAARALRCATTADKRDARTSLFALYNDTTDTHATHTFKLRIRNAICDAHDARRTRLGRDIRNTRPMQLVSTLDDDFVLIYKSRL